ncbi:MAG: sensor histidine kinase [Saprospiraceae bacterium]
MKVFVHQILTGTPPDDVEQRGTRIVWMLSCRLLPVIWVASALFAWSGDWINRAVCLFFSLVFSVPLLLIRAGKESAAKWFFMGELTLFTLVLPLQAGPSATTEWVAVLLPLVAYVVFDKDWHISWLGFGFVVYCIVQLIYRYHTPWTTPVLPGLFHMILAGTVSVFVYWLLVMFKQDIMRTEQIVLEQRDILLANQQAIAAQNAELLAANAELERQRATLQSLNTELRHFAHAASHDLKEPLRNMGSFAALLSRRIGTDPDNHEMLSFIENGAKRLSQMLDDLIVYGRVGADRAPAEPIFVADVLAIIEQNLRNQLLQAGGRIECQGVMPVIRAHRTLLVQLFQNLVSNGLKYRRDGVPPVVQIRFTRKDDNLLFVVRDNGIGIPAKYLKRVFEPFRRLHNRSEYEGSGIGLATCKKIVEQYGGRIWAESTGPETGTAFFIELPGSMGKSPGDAEAENLSANLREVAFPVGHRTHSTVLF